MAKIKPGTPHPNRKGLVMGKNGRYVAKSTYAKQVKASQPKPARQNVTGQRALPPAGQSGGSKPPRGTKQPGTTRNQPGLYRRSAAASKKAGSSMGSSGTGVRTAKGSPTKVGGSVASGLASGVGLEIASKMAQTIGQPGQSRMSRLGVQGPAKPKVKSNPKAKPKAKSSQSTKSGMTPAQLKAAQDKANADRRAGKLSNIPAPKAKVKAKPQTKKQRAYAADARNKEYDKLRKAGKTKEAEALGKKIAADARKKAPKNPYRVPQGGERKDRLSKQVKELKGMGKKKKKQSRANQAGWQGNRNY
jgi:hypothetical protein